VAAKLNNKNDSLAHVSSLPFVGFALLFADNRNSWLRFRYGRLSVDSDDHNFNKKCDINEDVDDVLVEYNVDTKCCDKINGNGNAGQYLDANGNTVNGSNQSGGCDECECLAQVDIDPPISKSTIISEHNEIQPNDESVVRKLMSMALSEYGEFDPILPRRIRY
jgi:hypothetical protein